MRRSKLVSISDIIFTAIIIACMLALWAFFVSGGTAGSTVVVRKDGQIIQVLSLSENTIFDIEGDYTNTIEISDHAVRVAHTDCPNHQCEKMGAIRNSGASIICAPNHVSVTIEDGKEVVDAVSG